VTASITERRSELTAYTLVPAGLIATSTGLFTGTVVVTVFVAVSITETPPELAM
jgi:hypothetical protein